MSRRLVIICLMGGGWGGGINVRTCHGGVRVRSRSVAHSRAVDGLEGLRRVARASEAFGCSAR
jgi:hypothetical protein